MRSARVKHREGAADAQCTHGTHSPPSGPLKRAISICTTLFLLTAANKLALHAENLPKYNQTRPATCAKLPLKVQRNHNLPKRLRGIFWIKSGQSARLISFDKATQSRDCSDKITLRLASALYFSSDSLIRSKLIQFLDPIHDIELDHPSFPTYAIVTPRINVLNSIPLLGRILGPVLRYRLQLVEPTKGSSTKWTRHRRPFDLEYDSTQAELVNIVDARGRRLRPIFSEWLSLCESIGDGGIWTIQ